MLTNQAIYTDLLSYLGHELGNGTPDEDQRILQDINAALQDIYTLGPDYLRRQRQMAVYQAPATITFAVTQGSKTVGGTPFTAAMIGCTVRLANDPYDNEVTGTGTLLYPVNQPTSSGVSATVYFDSFTLPANCIGVDGNVFLDDTGHELGPMKYQDKTIFKQRPEWAVDPYYKGRESTYVRCRYGYPEGYYLENSQINTGGQFGLRLRIWPMPQEFYSVKFIGMMVAPALALEDLEIGSNSPTEMVPLPGGLHETVLLPLARGKLSSYPHFLPSKRELVIAEAAAAIPKLNAINPQPQTGARMRAPYRMPHSR